MNFDNRKNLILSTISNYNPIFLPSIDTGTARLD